MHVLPFLHRGPSIVGRIEQFAGQPFRHTLSTPRSRVLRNPAQGQRQSSARPNLNRYLVRRPADPTRLHFHHRFHVVDRGFENLEGVVTGFLLDEVEGSIAHPLRITLLAARHQDIDELADQLVAMARIRRDLSLPKEPTSWHLPSSFVLRFTPHDSRFTPYFGRLAPYFDRPCLRSATPTASSVPLIIW